MSIPSASLHLVEYDSVRHRVWVLGQRCHHGATGALIAATALGGLAAARLNPRGTALLALTGTALMAHDWKDRTMWFRAGHGSQA